MFIKMLELHSELSDILPVQKIRGSWDASVLKTRRGGLQNLVPWHHSTPLNNN
jgi:hypothetical protein